MTNDGTRVKFPSWKIDLMTEAFKDSPVDESVTQATQEPSASTNVLTKVDYLTDKAVNCNQMKENSEIEDKIENSTASSGDVTGTSVIQSKLESSITREMVKSKTKIVDYEITKDSDSDSSGSGASTPEKRDSLLQAGPAPVQSTIVDIDTDSSEDSDFMILKTVVNARKVAGGIDGASVVKEIIEELLNDVVEKRPFYIVQDILNACLDQVDFSKGVNEKIDLQSSLVFGAEDIRYKKDGQKVVKKNALSVVLISAHTKNLTSFHDDIKSLASRARHIGEVVHPVVHPEVVRMDFVFTLERDRVNLHERIKGLVRPLEVYIETKAVPEKDLRYKDPPELTEEELLHIWHDNMSLNIFSGFEVKLLIKEETFCFQFESMSVLSLFLYCTLGLENALLGKVKQAASLYEPLSLKTKVRKKEKAVFFPLPVTYQPRSSVDLASLSPRFNFKIGNFKNPKGKPTKVTLDFASKKDLYVFLISPEARAFKEILFS